jgi:hypothetical protein
MDPWCLDRLSWTPGAPRRYCRPDPPTAVALLACGAPGPHGLDEPRWIVRGWAVSPTTRDKPFLSQNQPSISAVDSVPFLTPNLSRLYGIFREMPKVPEIVVFERRKKRGCLSLRPRRGRPGLWLTEPMSDLRVCLYKDDVCIFDLSWVV